MLKHKSARITCSICQESLSARVCVRERKGGEKQKNARSVTNQNGNAVSTLSLMSGSRRR